MQMNNQKQKRKFASIFWTFLYLSSYTTVVNRNNKDIWIYLDWKGQSIFLQYSIKKYLWKYLPLL